MRGFLALPHRIHKGVTMTNDYTCELCGDTLTSYRALMECEARCETEQTAARKGHTSPHDYARPTRHWDDD